MIRAAKCMTVFVGSLVIILVAYPILWWLGRPSEEYRGELVVDEEMEFDSDDLGMDVDDDYSGN